MKTENLTPHEAVDAMVSGVSVIDANGNLYWVDGCVIRYTNGRGSYETITVADFFDHRKIFKIKPPEPKKVKKTFYRAYYIGTEGYIGNTIWRESEERIRNSIGVSTIVEIETRDFMVPE